MLFGVGLCFADGRANGRIAREVWLTYIFAELLACVLGLLHGIFIWAGDILLSYGLAGPSFSILAGSWERELPYLGGLVTCVSSLFCLFLRHGRRHRSQPTGSGRGSHSSSRCAAYPDQVKIEEQWHALPGCTRRCRSTS